MFPRIHVCGTNASCSHTPNSFERSDHIVLEFLVSQIVRAHDYLCIAPPEPGTSLWPCVGVVFRATHYVCHVSRGDQLRHMAKYLCQPRGGLCTSQTCTRARLGETQNYGRYAEMHVHFFGTCTCCSTRDHRSGGFGTVVI